MATSVSDDVPLPSTSSDTISDEKKKEITIQAINLLAQGKRNLLCQEIPTAVDQLQEASKLLASTFGETSKECAEVYLTYGRALLELARLENGVLGNALQGVPSEEEGELSADDQFEKTDDMKESEENSQNDTGAVKTDDAKPDAEKVSEADDDKKKEADANNEDGDEDEEGEESMDDDEEDVGQEEEEGCTTENPDDVSNFQLAWEMLELAKIIYIKEKEDKMKLKASEACMMLGEISLETEQYEKAIDDMTQCLTIQTNHLEPENRLIAETHYQLGLAYLFNAQHHDALKNLEIAISVIKTKIEKLKKVEETGDTADMESPREKALKEITELEGILPEILAKVEDVKEEMKNVDAVKTMAKEAFSNAVESVPAFQSSDTTENTGKVHNIGHLIRKKRKPEEDESSPEDNEAKKSRPDVSQAKVGETEKDGEKEATVAGHKSTPNGVENGCVVENGETKGEKPVQNGVDKEHTANGHVTTDDAAGETGGKTEITVKTVEDVKAATEKSEEMETDAEPQST